MLAKTDCVFSFRDAIKDLEIGLGDTLENESQERMRVERRLNEITLRGK
jgi:hypothetical protein